MIRVLLSLALLLAPLGAAAQDSLATSTAPAPTQVRLPLVRTVQDGERVVLQVVGSTINTVGSADGLYIGPNGYTDEVEAAQDVRGLPGISGSDVETTGPQGPAGAPGMSAYQLWLSRGNEGSVDQYLAALVGPQGPAGPQGVAGPSGPQGAAGPKGDVGPAGPTGAAGAQGAAGSTGAAGPQGVAGSKGDTGATGAAGPIGPAGPTGPQGPIGATGSAGTSGATFLANVTFGQTAVVAIGLGPRPVTVALSGCAAGERVLLTPATSLPAGYGLLDAYCATAGQLTVNVYAPLLAIGASYSITAKVTVFR